MEDISPSSAPATTVHRRRIAIIAHDGRKEATVAWAKANAAALAGFDIVATGTTGGRIAEATGLPVDCQLSGPLGGDAQIGAMVATGKITAVFFLVDPLSVHPHEPDISGLQRLCNVHNVILATNLASADAALAYITGPGRA